MSSSPSTNARFGKHAIVIGGSLGGMLTARVLVNYFENVTVIERDKIPVTSEPRAGVPQGRHVHVIYSGGANVIERLMPGFFAELETAGSVVCDFANDLAWYHNGVWKMRVPSDLASYWQSRPFLEMHVRQRVLKDTDVRLIERCDVTKLLVKDGQVGGVELNHRDEKDKTEQMLADLVVDASGRMSQMPKWLEASGFNAPREETVEVDLCYASRVYRRPDDTKRDWKIMGQFGTPPEFKRTGYIFPIEDGRWTVSLVGFLNDHPPDDEDEFLEYARNMELPEVYNAIKDAEPLTPIARFKFPGNRNRHYEQLATFPPGLLVIGDAICAFNPVYGQGMSACALQVDLLDSMLRQNAAERHLADDFARQFFKRAAKIIANPWLLSTTSDFLYPLTRGKRPLGTRALNWYVTKVFGLCSCDKSVVLTFYRVLHFVKQPAALFHPYIFFRVMLWSVGLRGSHKASKERPLQD